MLLNPPLSGSNVTYCGLPSDLACLAWAPHGLWYTLDCWWWLGKNPKRPKEVSYRCDSSNYQCCVYLPAKVNRLFGVRSPADTSSVHGPCFHGSKKYIDLASYPCCAN